MNLVYPREWLVIANRALNLIGETALQDFTGTSESTQNITIQLPSVVQSVLSQHTFKCARKRTSLAAVLDAPAYGYRYAYQLPSDYCRIVEVNGTEDFSIEGDKLLSNDTGIFITYIALPETPQTLTPAIQECIVYLLAHTLARTTTTNDNLAVILYQQYTALLAQAIKHDDEGKRQDMYEEWWTENR